MFNISTQSYVWEDEGRSQLVCRAGGLGQWHSAATTGQFVEMQVHHQYDTQGQLDGPPVHRGTLGDQDRGSHGLTIMIWKFLLTPLANIVSTYEFGTVVLSLTKKALYHYVYTTCQQ